MNEALACAVRLLARREHGLAELADKLAQKRYVDADIQDALTTCERQGLQSDVRFAESLCRTRVRQGYGPIRIRQELLSKQINRDIIDDVLYAEHEHWLEHATRAWEKKYLPSDDVSFVDKQKQKQFLLYRGFAMETILAVVRT